MKSLIHFVAAASLSLGGFALTGCEETPQPQGENGVTAGGNGAFGENPVRAGEYKSNVAAPTTQPTNPQSTDRSAADDELGTPLSDEELNSRKVPFNQGINPPTAFDDEEASLPGYSDQKPNTPSASDDDDSPQSIDDDIPAPSSEEGTTSSASDDPDASYED